MQSPFLASCFHTVAPILAWPLSLASPPGSKCCPLRFLHPVLQVPVLQTVPLQNSVDFPANSRASGSLGSLMLSCHTVTAADRAVSSSVRVHSSFPKIEMGKLASSSLNVCVLTASLVCLFVSTFPLRTSQVSHELNWKPTGYAGLQSFPVSLRPAALSRLSYCHPGVPCPPRLP